jgi:hypothetical protein
VSCVQCAGLLQSLQAIPPFLLLISVIVLVESGGGMALLVDHCLLLAPGNCSQELTLLCPLASTPCAGA